MFRKLIIGILLLLMTGCTSLQSVSTSSIPTNRKRPVEFSSDRFIFLGFNFNNNYVDKMAEGLAKTCPKGKVKGILTKHENIIYFPIIAHKVRVTSRGYCVR